MVILNKIRVFSELLVYSALVHDFELQYLMSQTRWVFLLNDFLNLSMFGTHPSLWNWLVPNRTPLDTVFGRTLRPISGLFLISSLEIQSQLQMVPIIIVYLVNNANVGPMSARQHWRVATAPCITQLYMFGSFQRILLTLKYLVIFHFPP